MSESVQLHNLMPPKLFEYLERAGITTARQILLMSLQDMKRITNLNEDDIDMIKNNVSRHLCPQIHPSSSLMNCKTIGTGVFSIDQLLLGGFQCGMITEIYGESGTGKTQIGIQTALHNWKTGCIYICTEDVFPIKRFSQMKENFVGFNPETDYGKNIFVEHITEPDELLGCVRVRIPKLLMNNSPSLIIVDSVAAPFRTETTNYIQRAEDLRELAVHLIKIAQEHNIAILCINQVTSSFNDTDLVLPSLGLAWSNVVNTRLWLKKGNKCNENAESANSIREMEIMFSPYLKNKSTEFLITTKGLEDVQTLQ